MAQDPAVCVSTSGPDTAHPRPGASGGSVANSGGPVLASEDMVREHCSVAVRDAVVSSSVQRSAAPGRGADSASSAGAVGAVGLPAERERLMAAGFPVDVVATIQSARAPLTRGLYAFKWRIFEE